MIPEHLLGSATGVYFAHKVTCVSQGWARIYWSDDGLTNNEYYYNYWTIDYL